MSTITAKTSGRAAIATASRRSRRTLTMPQIVAVLVLIAIGSLFVIPFLWMLITSLKAQQDVFNPNWLPRPIRWANYPESLTALPFGRYLINTAIITIASVLGSVFSSALVAYSFARLRWPGREFWFSVVLATMILPGIVTLIPKYILFAKIGWVDTFLPLIVPTWLGGGAFYIFLLRQFFRGIPPELTEAARIDGAGELRIWWQIFMPLCRPALAAITIFSFNGAWDDYLNPLIYLHSEKLYTLQLGLTAFKGGGGGVPQWNLMMAASLVVLLPIILIFFFGQKYFIEGVSLSGLGGR